MHSSDIAFALLPLHRPILAQSNSLWSLEHSDVELKQLAIRRAPAENNQSPSPCGREILRHLLSIVASASKADGPRIRKSGSLDYILSACRAARVQQNLTKAFSLTPSSMP